MLLLARLLVCATGTGQSERMNKAPQFVPESDVPYGTALPVSPLVRRIVAHNPSPFTYTGTGTFIIGHGTVAVIDPGPTDPAHISAILAATTGETISHIVITHTHRDHSPGAVPLKAATGTRVVGCAPLVLNDDGPRSDESFDQTYVPDQVLIDGDTVTGPGWTLRAVATPGHTSNHVCYCLEEERALFTGDHVMGWSTTVVSPPDGNMTDYVASLRKLLTRNDVRYYPTHGKPVEKPQKFVRALITHRKMREAQIVECLKDGMTKVPDIVARLYAAVPSYLHAAAGRSVLAHLEDLQSRNRVAVHDGFFLLVA
jgi:glyoxylase-like metal-dependent hydrolase (beta-lactamase superfamily II)